MMWLVKACTPQRPGVGHPERDNMVHLVVEAPGMAQAMHLATGYLSHVLLGQWKVVHAIKVDGPVVVTTLTYHHPRQP